MIGLRDIAAYAERLAALMPRGLAWPEAGGAVWGQLMAALAPEFRRVDARLLALMDEADPRTTAEGLADWERVLGLPDDCAPQDASFAERRNAVIARLRSLGGASPAYFKGICADLGYDVEIIEYTPFTCGVSRCGGGDQTGSPLMRFNWSVIMPERRVRWFRIGDPSSRVGRTPMAIVDRARELECLITRLAPAHTLPTFVYSDVEGFTYPLRIASWFRTGDPNSIVGLTPMATVTVAD